MNVIFCGSSEYCLPVANSIKSNFTLSAIISKKGSKVNSFAADQNILLFTPRNGKDLKNLEKQLKKIKPDLMVVADYGLIIPQEIFSLPEKQSVNIHFSRLPKFRGASPVQYTILYGEKSAFITFQKMAAKMDTGEIILQQKFPINDRQNSNKLYHSLFREAALLLPRVLNDYCRGEIKLHKQDEKNVSFTKILTRDDGFLPFRIFSAVLSQRVISLDNKLFPEKSALYEALTKSDSPAKTIERAVRAFTPWPGVWTIIPSGKRLKILQSKVQENLFTPERVQLEGKNTVNWKQFLEGYPEVKKLVPD